MRQTKLWYINLSKEPKDARQVSLFSSNIFCRRQHQFDFLLHSEYNIPFLRARLMLVMSEEKGGLMAKPLEVSRNGRMSCRKVIELRRKHRNCNIRSRIHQKTSIFSCLSY